ncbi:MAG: sulfatase [Planctomycetota bacterium]
MMRELTPNAWLVLLCGLVLLLAGVARAEDRPNIVFIIADDLGYTDLGCYGSDFYRTPNLDRFAGQAMRLTDGYANCANCAPTRAALMSGMYAPRTGVYTVGNAERGRARGRMLIPTTNNDTLDPGVVTLAEVLNAAGYTTAHLGKWHLGEPGTSAGPLAQGFDLNVGGNHGGSPRSYFSPYRNPALEDGPVGEYLTDRLTREAVAFMSQHAQRDQPFFLYLSFYTVHTPIQPEPTRVDSIQQRQPGERHRHVKYAAMVEAMDHYTGRVLDALDDLGLADNTIVIFTSDNGGHGSFTDQHPLRGSKGMFYEGGIRVPLIVRWPGVTKPGSECDEPVLLFDFYPTLTAAAGGELPADQPVDGVDLGPVLRDPGATLGRDAIYFHFPAYLQGYAGGEGAEAQRPPWRATPCSVVRSGDWKLLLYFETDTVELFNLKDDPGEQNDLAATNPAKAMELLTMLRLWHQETNAAIPTERNPEFVP